MKKALIWIAASLMVMGIVLFAVAMYLVDFDFTKVSNVKYQTNTYEFSVREFNKLDLDTITADVEFRKSEDDICRIVCFEHEKMLHDVYIKDHALMVSVEDTRSWFEHITIFNYKVPTVTVYLPEGEYNALKIENTTGDVKISGNWNFSSIDLNTTTGDIDVSGVTCQGDMFAKVTTGKTTLKNLVCKNLTANGTTGDLMLNNVLVSDTMRAKCSTGDIKFDGCDAGEVYIKCTTGDVTGTFLTPKVIFANSTTGKVDVPKYTTGGRCEIDVTTGSIRVKIA